jgi:hypothetical protein
MVKGGKGINVTSHHCKKGLLMLLGRTTRKSIVWAGEVPGKEVLMQRSPLLWKVSYAGMCALITVAACAVVPVVQSTCVISWGRSADWRIDHYKVSVWRDGESLKRPPHTVNAPATQVSCHEVGVSSVGKWEAAIQACLKDGTCSEFSTPISFKVMNK